MVDANSKMLNQVYIQADKVVLRNNKNIEYFIKNKLELNKKIIKENLLQNE